MDLDEAIRFARVDGGGPSAGQQALGLIVRELDTARAELWELRQDLRRAFANGGYRPDGPVTLSARDAAVLRAKADR